MSVRLAQPRVGAYGELLPQTMFSRRRDVRVEALTPRSSVWTTHYGLVAISSKQQATAPDGTGEVIPQWHISIARHGLPQGAPAEAHRPSMAEVMATIKAFVMPAWEEDNHHPGVARHLWCPLDEARRVDCECKIGEMVVVDGDYSWTTDPELGCRGCDYERLMASIGRHLPCPLHPDGGF